MKSKSYYPWLVVVILLLAYTLSFIDRTIISLLIGPIREDLQISDTQISLLIGIAFALFYTIMGIPIARMADRKSRRNIIVVGITVWSIMTACCGIAKNYWSLFLARLGVGVGEAALSPAAYSMISDYFSKKRLSLALSIYGSGPYFGSGLAYILGGATVEYLSQFDQIKVPLLGEVASWQAAFMVVGLPGVLVAIIIALIVKEPARQPVTDNQSPNFFKGALPYIVKHKRFYLCHFFGVGLVSLIAYSSLSWLPEFFKRNYQWSAGEIATPLGFLVMIFGTLGISCGGFFAEYLQNKRGKIDATMRALFIGSFLLMPAVLGAVLVDSPYLSLCFFGLLFFAVAFPFGSGIAALQIATPSYYRAQVSAVYLFINNLVGLAAGPTAVALCTDYLFKNDAMLGYSIGLVCACAAFLASLLLYFSLKPFRAMVKGSTSN